MFPNGNAGLVRQDSLWPVPAFVTRPQLKGGLASGPPGPFLNRIVQNCAPDGSSGLSGAPLFRLEGQAKKLVGSHVNHTGSTREATLWPGDFLAKYLATKGVAQTPYSEGFMAAAKKHIKLNLRTLHEYLKSEWVPFHLRIEHTFSTPANNIMNGNLTDRRVS